MTFIELQETYRLLGRLRSGSGGDIILAEHKRLNQKVILKRIIRPSKDERINRREAEILKRLRHESLPVVYDYLEVEGDIYTVMDFIDGEALDKKAESGNSFSLNEIRKWGIEISEALTQLHSQNPKILHLDIKPANIMIRENGKAVLIDFNVSLDGSSMARMGYTLYFCSPEQKQMIEFAKAHRTAPDVSKLSEESDIYSLGAVLYYLAAGRNYDPADPQWEILSRRYPGEFIEILRKALQENPAYRYHSAAALKRDLQSMEGASQAMQDWKKKVRIRNWICYGSLCACIVLFGYSFFLMHQEKQDRYDQIVDEMVQKRNDAQFDEIDDLFNEARSIAPNQLNAFYQRAASLYDQGSYKEASDFINQSILADPEFKNRSEGLENTYYLLADSLYQQKEYKESADVYDQLFELEELQPVFYRDYAITLGYNHQFQKAADILEQASARGLDNGSLTYANAEISWAQGKPEEAIALMQQALGEVKEDSVRMHAFEKIAEWNLEIKNYKAAREILLKAREDLPKNLQPVILQTLIQTDSKLADQTDDNKYRQEAVNAIQEIIDNDWAVYSDYNNMAVFYQKMGKLDQADQAVSVMSEKYGEDYNVFKRQAFIEIDRQQMLANEKRNYRPFEKMYKKAKEQYVNSGESDDLEMPLLDSLYQDLQKGGWL